MDRTQLEGLVVADRNACRLGKAPNRHSTSQIEWANLLSSNENDFDHWTITWA